MTSAPNLDHFDMMAAPDGGRPERCALRPSPGQASYLGWPGPTGRAARPAAAEEAGHELDGPVSPREADDRALLEERLDLERRLREARASCYGLRAGSPRRGFQGRRRAARERR